MENSKGNKKIIIAIVAVLVVIVAIALIAIFAKPSYKSQIKKFAEACESEEKMEKYIEKTFNLRAFYAMSKAKKPEDFDEEYKKAKKDDYKDEKFVSNVKDLYLVFTEADKVEIKDIEKLKDPKDIGGNYEDTYGKIKGFKIAKCKMKIKYNGETVEQDIDAIFYKGKLVTITMSLDEMNKMQNQLETTRKNIEETQKDLEEEQRRLDNYSIQE